MTAFTFDVDENWAKEHNEMLRDTRSLTLSGIALFILCLAAAVAVWVFVDPASPWHLLGTLALALFGVMMLIVGLAIPKSVGTAQSLYGAHPLAPAIIAGHPGTRTTLLALVNTSVDASAPRWALTVHDVSNIPHVDNTVGAKVPVAAVGGRRDAADQDHWKVITPMPIAWGTPDAAVVARALAAIPDEQWRTLRANKDRVDEVRRAKNDLLPL
ncbi:Protein of unknown function [Corynebacterium mycetoides]|uniref:DUF3239 domain-containing protein n=1 Tax=Corynebacterium mycetoides TaxID=38302 RepID=A0A1G9L9V4_9CORY|nr:DUF3239 domain-containing protein [Corynebacterium mycetoides]SDL58335.1 Protein of unknown function [Corynebacterium mycetoides]